MHAILAAWAPPDERSLLGSIVYAGINFNLFFQLSKRVSLDLNDLIKFNNYASGKYS